MLITKYQDIIDLGVRGNGGTNVVRHKIDPGDVRPNRQPVRKFSLAKLEEADKIIKEVVD